MSNYTSTKMKKKKRKTEQTYTSKENDLVIKKKTFTKINPRPNGFTDKFQQTFEKKLIHQNKQVYHSCRIQEQYIKMKHF